MTDLLRDPARRSRSLAVLIGGALCGLAIVLVGSHQVEWFGLGSGRLLLGVFAVSFAILICLPIALDRSRSDSDEPVAAAATVVGSLGSLLTLAACRLPADVEAGTLSVVCLVTVALASLALVRRLAQVEAPAVLAQALLEWLQMWTCICLALWAWCAGWQYVVPVTPWLPPLAGGLVALLMTFCVTWGTRESDLSLRAMAISTPVVLAGAFAVFYARIVGLPQWPGALLGALGWTVVLFTFACRGRLTRPSPPERTERTRVMVVGTLMAIGLLSGLAGVLLRAEVSVVAWLLVFAFVVSTWAREQVEAGRTTTMLNILSRRALEDPLTGLRNRRALGEWLDTVQPETGLSVISIDLDQFKDVNDLLGQTAGDRYLASVAQHLSVHFEPVGGEVFRMGGDEFAIAVSGDPVPVRLLAMRLPDVIAEAAFRVPGVERLGVGCSAGLRQVAGPLTRKAIRDSVLQSGRALQAAKTDGKGKVHVFSDALGEEYQRRKLVELRLRENLTRVTVTYQPIVDPRSSDVVGFEALARWVDDELGPVSPLEFIGVAETTGLIHDLGRHILRTALRELVDAGLLVGRRVNVNVSALQLRRPGFTDSVLAALSEVGMPGSCLALEVTETIPIEAEGQAARTMAALSAAGVRMAIDDFGAGATSVSYLSRLPVSTVKLDRALTVAIHEPGTSSVVRGLVEMCRGLGLDTVLEGVEDRAQRDLAVQHGVTYLQGWLYAKAVPVVEVPELLRRLEGMPAPRSPA